MYRYRLFTVEGHGPSAHGKTGWWWCRGDGGGDGEEEEEDDDDDCRLCDGDICIIMNKAA